MTIPNAIYRLRMSSGQTQRDFAAQLGVSLRGYSNYELGRRAPGPLHLAALVAFAEFAGQPEIKEAFLKELGFRRPLAPGFTLVFRPSNAAPHPSKPFTLGVL